MKKLFIVFTCAILLFPFYPTHASADIGLKPYTVKFSERTDSFISGQTVRVYISAVNYGGDDSTATVLIYRDNQLIGERPVSLIAGSVEDEVFTDFVVPEQPFRMYFELKGIEPGDNNASNNQVLSPLYDVDIDTDGDGLSNSDDTDDDNDGLLDYEEDRINTDYLNWDTDGDGFNDKADAFPLDPSKYRSEESEPIVEEPEVVEPPVEPVPAPEPAPAPVEETVVQPVASVESEEEMVGDFYQSAEVTLLNEIHIKSNQINWNTFNFSFSTNLDDLDVENLEYVWVYGDGEESTQNGSHRFNKTGDYFVTLKVKGPWQSYYYDNVKITVGWWSVYNYWLWLIVLAVVLILFVFGTGIRHRPKEVVEKPVKKKKKKTPEKSIAKRQKRKPKQKKQE